MSKIGPEGQVANLVYVFVPFRFDGDGGAGRDMRIRMVLDDAIGKCRDGTGGTIWGDCSKDIRSYFLKHLTDKIVSSASGKMNHPCCVHLCAKPRDLGCLAKDRFQLLVPSYMTDSPKGDVSRLLVTFCVDSVNLSLFGTGLGIVSFGIILDTGDAMTVSFAEQLLKMSVEPVAAEKDEADKLSEAKRSRLCGEAIIRRTGGAEGPTDTDFTAIAKKVVGSCVKSAKAEFGFYSQKPRASLFTLFVEEGSSDAADFEKKLYYLSNGYGDGFMYPDDGKNADARYIGDQNICWGVSNEVVCCYVRPGLYPKSRQFIERSFYGKFRHEYLFMYIWLLHQKYVLYAFLTDVSAYGLSDPARANVRELRRYKDRFVDFESNYVFARITDVPQYQQLYDAIGRQFTLRTMYADVKEPLVALEDLARDKEQRVSTGITIILAVMGILTVFSAYVDSYDFIGKFFDSWTDGRVRAWQIVCVVCITIFVVVGLSWILLFSLRGGIFKSKGLRR